MERDDGEKDDLKKETSLFIIPDWVSMFSKCARSRSGVTTSGLQQHVEGLRCPNPNQRAFQDYET